MYQAKLLKIESSLADHQVFYAEFTSRNFHFIDEKTQVKLRDLKILIAGCGSTGGACIEALARAGAENIYLADNGDYEVSNLNRQHFRLDNVGENKAEFHREEILNINPYINCKVFNKGIQSDNVAELCEWADFIFDAVDVTTPDAMKSKIDLHINAKKFKKPLISALDLGFKQWGVSYDYRKDKIDVLKGKLPLVQKCKNPLKALFIMYPMSIIPSHSYELIFDLLTRKKDYASQIGCTSDLLSGIIVPTVLRFVKDGHLVKGWSFDQSKISKTYLERLEDFLMYLPRRRKLKKLLSQID